jgi:hypothetical protein
MEPKVSVQCRSKDIPAVEKAIADARATCVEKLKLDVVATIDKANPLPETK